MFNIVIIDDEALAIRKLELLLRKMEISINSIEYAENGLDGYHLIKNKKPNLIFTDIQMPVMDGLEMIKKLRDDGIETPIVILSCHESFTYAKKAICLNTYDYLIKDFLNTAKLENLFCRILSDKIIHSENNIIEHQNLSSALHHMLDAVDKLSIKILSRHFDYLMSSDRLVLFQLKLNFLSSFIVNSLDYNNLKTLQDKLQAILSNQTVITIHNRNIVILTSVNSGPSRLNFITQCHGISQLIIKSIEGYVDLYMITISQTFTSIDQIRSHYLNIIKVSRNMLPSKMNPIFFSDETKYSTRLTYEIIDDCLKELLEHVNTLDLVKIQQIIYRLFNTNENGFIQLSYLNYLHICLFACLKNSLSRNKLDTQRVLGRKYLSLDEIESLTHISDIEAWYIDKFEIIVNHLKRKRENNFSPKINQAIALIEATPTISLQQLSNELDINKSYLCRLFKKEVSVNLTEYTLKYRIEKAKELLISTQHKISDISKKLGYIYPHQFSKDFKKITGIMPTVYRRLHHNGH